MGGWRKGNGWRGEKIKKKKKMRRRRRRRRRKGRRIISTTNPDSSDFPQGPGVISLRCPGASCRMALGCAPLT